MTVDFAELRLALRALTGGGDGEAALASALEASAGRGLLPRYRVPQVFAGLRRRAEAALLSLALLVPTPDGTAYQVQTSTTPERIEAALAEQAREREARRAAREAAAARRKDTSPEALEARTQAQRTRKAANKAAQRARERGDRSTPAPVSHFSTSFEEPSGPPVPAPVTASAPVTPPPMSPAASGDIPGDTPPDVTAPVTDSLASAPAPASDPPSPSRKFNSLGEGGSPDPTRELTAPVTAPVTAPAPVTPPSPPPPATPEAPSSVLPSPTVAGDPPPPSPAPTPAWEAQLQQVIVFWLLSFAQRPVSEEQVGEPDQAAVAQRLREPGGLEHVLLAVKRASRRGSWFWQGDPGRCRLLVICGKKFPELVAEALAESPAPPSVRASPPSMLAFTSPASARSGWPDPPEKVPQMMPGDSFPGADKEEPLSWAGCLWGYDYGTRSWWKFGADPNARRGTG